MEYYIIVKFKKDVNADEYHEPFKELFAQAEQIEGVKRADVFTTNTRTRNRFDLMIKISMKKSALKAFEESPLYKNWQNDYKDVIQKTTIFSC